MGLSSRSEWEEYSCAGAYQLPKDPDVVWADSWRGWDDWLGTMLPWAEARAAVRSSLHICSEEDYLELVRGERHDDALDTGRLPSSPQRYYSQHWAGWDDFLHD